MNKNLESLNKKSYWKKIFKKISIFLAVFVVTMIMNVYLTAREVLNEEWQDMGSPIDFQWEYQSIQVIETLRTFLINRGVNEENFFNLYLKNKQRKYLNEIRNKIGEDVLLDFMTLKIEYLSCFVKDIKNENLSNLINNNIDKFFTKKSRISNFEQLTKYHKIGSLIDYLIITNDFKHNQLCDTFLNYVNGEKNKLIFYKNDKIEYLINSLLLTSLAYCLYADADKEDYKLCENEYFMKLNKNFKDFNIDTLPQSLTNKNFKDFYNTKETLKNFRTMIFKLDHECKYRKIN